MSDMTTSSVEDFPHAPTEWSVKQGSDTAIALGIVMGPEQWEIVLCLQEYFARNENPNRRELNDALEEFWHAHGGLKAIYKLFPGGPIAQGCEIGGIDIPPGTIDVSFGSTS